jgi:hypothetical protein
MKCFNCKFLFTLPIDNARQDYHVCEKGVWEGPEIAFGRDYGLDCKEFEKLELEDEKTK